MSASMMAQGHLGVNASSATSTEEYEFTDLTMDMVEDLHDQAGTRGTRSHPSERVRQNTRAPKMTFTLEPNSVELDAWLPRILGGAESSDAFPLAETLGTFVVNVDAVASRLPFTGCVVNKATFKSTQGQALKLTLDIEALDMTPSGTAFATLTISAVGPYIHSDVVVSVSGTSYSFKDVTLVVDNMLATDRFFNSQTRASLPTKDRVITWTLDGPYGDNSAIYGLTAAGVAVVGTWTLGNRSLIFSSTKVAFPRKLPTTQGKEEIMLPLEGIARKDGTTLELTCTNDSSG